MFKSYSPVRRRTTIGASLTLLLVIGALFSGCSLGPVELGGSSSPTQVVSGAPGTSGPQTAPSTPTAQPTPTEAARALTGKVVDSYTSQPIAGAEVTAGNVLTETTPDGVFSFDAVPLESKLSARADGYAEVALDPGTSSNLIVKLRPNTISGRVVDGGSGKSLAGVLVKLTWASTLTATGTITATPAVTATLVATATQLTTNTLGYARILALPGSASTPTPSAGTTVTSGITATQVVTPATPLPPTATATPKPIPPTGPDFVAVYTDENGSYFFKDVPENATLTYKLPGYKIKKIPTADAAGKDTALEVFEVHAIYLTAPVMATKSMYNPLIDFVANSKLNAVVVNVQNDNSEWVFDAKNPDAVNAKNTDVFLPNMADQVKALHDKGIYVIARVVTFQQPTLAKARLDLAVKSSVTGKAWLGGELNQQAWIDPSIPATHDYMLAMTKEVLDLGFDEIQYDYVRFPSDPAPREPGKPTFRDAPDDIAKAEAVQAFLKKAHDLIEPTDAFMSIDVFGYTLWPDRADGPVNGVIGQVFEYLIDNTDYMCPMIYPSHFSPGESGCPRPAGCAYQMVHVSGEFALKRFEGTRAKYRPWLQDFDWYPNFDYTSPGTTKVAEQIQAAEETGAWGWQMWDPANDYEPRSVFKK